MSQPNDTEPTRLYIKSDSSTFCRFMWFHNYAVNEMLMGVYGLSKKEATLDFIFPERRVSEEELRALRFKYSDLREIKQEVDHITCHADGTFHIKTRGGKEVYRDSLKRQEPLGADTPVFLDFIVISDMAINYCITSTTPKYPHIWLCCKQTESLIIEGKFSGANYQVETELASRALMYGNFQPCLSLASSTIKGILWPRAISISKESSQKRPKGTIILFKFPTAIQSYLIKGFIFS